MTAVNETYENWKHFKMRNWGSREFSSGYNKVCRLQWPPPWCGTGFRCWQRWTILFCRCCSWRPAETGPFRGCSQPPRRGINSLKAASAWHVFCLFNSSSVAFVLGWYAGPDTPTPGSTRMHRQARIYDEHSESVWHTNTRRNICNYQQNAS